MRPNRPNNSHGGPVQSEFMSTPSIPAAIPEQVVRFPLRRLLAATTAAALVAAVLGPVYRLAPPQSRSELLAFWSGYAAIGVVLTLRAWWRTYRTITMAGPTRFILLRPDRPRLQWSWMWGFTPIPWYVLFIVWASLAISFGTLGLTQQKLPRFDAVQQLGFSGLILGVMFWPSAFALVRKFHRPRWLRLCDDGVVANGTVVPWSAIIRGSWHFMHPEQLMLSTWVRPYSADVPAAQRESVEQFVRQHAAFDDDQPHPAAEGARL
jgi:hypothetical protein